MYRVQFMNVEKIKMGKVEKLVTKDGIVFYTLEITCESDGSNNEQSIMFFSDNAENLKIKK